MALRSGLTVYFYTAPTATAQPLVVRAYRREVQRLRLGWVEPGGYGDFYCELALPDARLPHPELALFSRIVVRDGPTTVWEGEVSEPRLGMAEGGGGASEYVHVAGLGIGNMLRDDSLAARVYSGQTVQQVAQAEWTVRTATFHTFPLSADQSQLFPDNPAGAYSPSYDNKTVEEILADLCTLASSATGGVPTVYQWGVEAHPLGDQPGNTTQADAAGFPLARVFARQVDYATVAYRASVAAREVVAYDVAPAAERAYNVVSIGYLNGSAGVAYATAKDTRLGASDNTQQTAPFRFRKYVRDYSNLSTVTSSVAQALANTILAQYQNPTNKVQITLRGVRDAAGNPLDLWRVDAFNRNILVPEMAVRGAQLPTAAAAGVNLFHIVAATYEEQTAQDARLTLQCDNFVDYGQILLARLSLAADARLRSVKTGAYVQQPGQPEIGECGVSFLATAGGQTTGEACNFRTVMANVPTSIGLTQLLNTNATNPTVSQLTAVGFYLKATSVGSGLVEYVATYKTAGNTLLAVDGAAPGGPTLDWHCDGCDTVHQGVALYDLGPGTPTDGTRAYAGDGGASLGVVCGACHMSEQFNTRLTAADAADGADAARARTATLVRQALAALGIAPATTTRAPS